MSLRNKLANYSMRNNLVSIITPSYNSSKFIEECVNSVISQTFQNWEMIIIDDCSNDNSRDIISELSEKDERIKNLHIDYGNALHPIKLGILGKKLKRGGYIYGVVHDEKSIMAKILGKRWPPYSLQHPHLFNPNSINNLFERLHYDKNFIVKTMNFFNLVFLFQNLFIAIFKKKINSIKIANN